jgi:hypothetical protein
VFTSTSDGRANAFSVRCFKNAPAPVISSVVYTPAQGTWTSGSVTVTVTLDQDGSTLADWTLNGKVFTKTFTANRARNVSFPNAQGTTVTTGISVQNIDKTAPTISSISPSTTASTNGNVTLTITASDA